MVGWQRHRLDSSLVAGVEELDVLWFHVWMPVCYVQINIRRFSWSSATRLVSLCGMDVILLYAIAAGIVFGLCLIARAAWAFVWFC